MRACERRALLSLCVSLCGRRRGVGGGYSLVKSIEIVGTRLIALFLVGADCVRPDANNSVNQGILIVWLPGQPCTHTCKRENNGGSVLGWSGVM